MTVPLIRRAGHMYDCEACGKPCRKQYELLSVAWDQPEPLVLHGGGVAQLLYWYLCIDCCLRLPELQAFGALAGGGE